MFLPILMSFVFSFAAEAQQPRFEHFTRVSLQDKFTAPLDLNTETVRCSQVGYGMEELKISVPVLKWMAIFDHANIGEEQPCMTAGACKAMWMEDGHTVEEFLARISGPQIAEIQRVLSESFALNHDQRSCKRTLSESLETTVGGVKFNHVVSKHIGDLPFEACLEIQATL